MVDNSDATAARIEQRAEVRLGQLLWDQTQVESLFIRMARNATEAFREGLCIAMSAPGGDFGAPSDWVPGGVRPLDGGMVAHND